MPWHEHVRRLTAPSGSSGRALLLILGVSVALRLAAAIYLGNSVAPLPGIYDQVSYHALAMRVLGGHGFSFGNDWWPATAANEPTAHWSFLYVLFLSGIYAVAGPYPLAARLVQALAVGVLHPLLTYRVAARVFGERVGLVSAGVAAGYAYFVYYAGALLTESFYIVAILWALDRAMALADVARNESGPQTRRWVGLGLAAAAAVLLRQVILIVVPLVLAWAWWHASGRGLVGRGSVGRPRTAAPGSATLGAAMALLIVAAAVLPWTIRNHAAFHRFVLLNTNAGFAFYWGNHPIHGDRFVPILPERTYARLIPDDLSDLDEASMERVLLQRGLAFVADDPVRYLKLSASRLQEYLKFWPSRESGRVSNLARVLSFGVCLPFMAGGVILSLRRGRSGASRLLPLEGAGSRLLIGVAALYTAVHLLTWTLIRYRLPVDAVLLPFAGLAIVAAWDALQSPARSWAGNRDRA